MRGPTLLVGLLVLTGLLAGCTSGDEGGPQTTPDAETSEAGTGTVEGTVVDVSINPLDGARITVKGIDREVFADADGRFRIANLEPGRYTVFAEALGYQPNAKLADVKPDDTTKLSFQLEPLAVEEVGVAYWQDYAFSGFLACGGAVGPLSFTDSCNDPNHEAYFNFSVNGSQFLNTIVVAMTWQPPANTFSRELSFDLWQNTDCTDFCDPQHDYGHAEGESPIVLRSNGTSKGVWPGIDPMNETELEIFIWVPFGTLENPAAVSWQQKFDLYITVFYVDPPDPEFTGIPDQ